MNAFQMDLKKKKRLRKMSFIDSWRGKQLFPIATSCPFRGSEVSVGYRAATGARCLVPGHLRTRNCTTEIYQKSHDRFQILCSRTKCSAQFRTKVGHGDWRQQKSIFIKLHWRDREKCVAIKSAVLEIDKNLSLFCGQFSSSHLIHCDYV